MTETTQTELDLGSDCPLEISGIMEIGWKGPFAVPGFEKINGLPPLVGGQGVYLINFKYDGGYIIWYGGMTGRTFRERFAQHRRNYRDGKHGLLDIGQAQQGVNSEIWAYHGERQIDQTAFELQDGRAAVERQLAAYHLFVTDQTLPSRRLQFRLEAAILRTIDRNGTLLWDRPDWTKRWSLSPRRVNEAPILAINIGAVDQLYDLPRELIF